MVSMEEVLDAAALLGRDFDYFASFILPAVGAGTMREFGFVAIGAL
jgi:hypothetical protein